MSTCPNCGHTKSGIPAILKWCIGLALFAVVGFPVLIVLLLAAVAAIGNSAAQNHEGDYSTEVVLQSELNDSVPVRYVSEEAQ